MTAPLANATDDVTTEPTIAIADQMERLQKDLYTDLSHLSPAERFAVMESHIGDLLALISTLTTLIVGQASILDTTVEEIVAVVNAQGKAINVMREGGTGLPTGRKIMLLGEV